METAWNPRKGTIKNTKIQEKWNNKIAKKLEANEKNNQNVLEKLRKKASKKHKQLQRVYATFWKNLISK